MLALESLQFGQTKQYSLFLRNNYSYMQHTHTIHTDKYSHITCCIHCQSSLLSCRPLDRLDANAKLINIPSFPSSTDHNTDNFRPHHFALWGAVLEKHTTTITMFTPSQYAMPECAAAAQHIIIINVCFGEWLLLCHSLRKAVRA